MDIKEIPENIEQQMMDYMNNNLAEHENPKVGIFWYSPAKQDLFGIVSIDAKQQAALEYPRKMVSCKELHKYVWKKKYNYYKFHPELKCNLFNGDYKLTPRGRIFYLPEENKYIIAIGSWINEYPEVIELVKIEFNLENENVEVQKGIHWEIGMGYGD